MTSSLTLTDRFGTAIKVGDKVMWYRHKIYGIVVVIDLDISMAMIEILDYDDHPAIFGPFAYVKGDDLMGPRFIND